jgi:hypothetical protein
MLIIFYRVTSRRIVYKNGQYPGWSLVVELHIHILTLLLRKVALNNIRNIRHISWFMLIGFNCRSIVICSLYHVTRLIFPLQYSMYIFICPFVFYYLYIYLYLYQYLFLSVYSYLFFAFVSCSTNWVSLLWLII